MLTNKLKLHSGQKMEKENSNMRKIYHKKCNNEDPTTSTMQSLLRRQVTSKNERVTWSYNMLTPRPPRPKKRCLGIDATEETEEQFQLEKKLEFMSSGELKAMCKPLQIKTKVRKPEKLIKLILDNQQPLHIKLSIL